MTQTQSAHVYFIRMWLKCYCFEIMEMQTFVQSNRLSLVFWFDCHPIGLSMSIEFLVYFR